MIRTSIRTAATASRETQVFNAVENLSKLLEAGDRSSYILAQYIPQPARHAFIAIRAFNLEINKINDGGNNMLSVSSKAASLLSSSLGFSTVDMKFKFWSDMLGKVFTDPHSPKNDNLGEPIAILLREALRNDLNLDISYFHQFLQTRKHFLQSKQFRTADDICSYGEGTYSQLNYLVQGLLLSPLISPSVISLLEYSPILQNLITDIAAHIGQATAVGSMILGVPYYSKLRNQITLPVDLMTQNDISQEQLLRLTQGHISDTAVQKEIQEQLKNVVYETATKANDHLLTARSKFEKVKDEINTIVKENPDDRLLQKQHRNWKRGVPDVIFTPFMTGIPTTLYLLALERHDFDIFHPKLQQKEWRLPWYSFKDYYLRRF